MAEEKQLLLAPEECRSGYQTVTPRNRKESAPLVFCIHGNKWGVASCCDDLEEKDAHATPEGATQTIQIGHQEGGKFTRTESQNSLHCHQARQDGIDKKARRKLVTATVLCVFFMLAEIVGGVLSNSLAIATDAAHLLTDFASFLISLFAIWMAAKPKSQKMSFGWHRAEVLGATVSVLMIWLVTGILVYLAIIRVINREFEIDATAMLITSGLGVAVNIVMGATLHQHGHSHGGGGGGGHGHSHGGAPSGGGHGHAHDAEHGEEDDHVHEVADKENINVTAAFIHVVGDFLQSLGVFIAAIVIYFKPEWNIIDPICTFIFSLLVLGTTISILRKTLSVLLEATPSDINYDIVKSTFLSVKGIRQIHSLRIWGLTTDKAALAAHLAIDKGLNAQQVLQAATVKIRAEYNFYEMTLQVEEFQDDMTACDQCKEI